VKLINPTASPNLSKEAKWVAQEMRRAVKQTMHHARPTLFLHAHISPECSNFK